MKERLIEKLVAFFIILGVVLALIHLDVIGLWWKYERYGVVQINVLSGHTRTCPALLKKSKEGK